MIKNCERPKTVCKCFSSSVTCLWLHYLFTIPSKTMNFWSLTPFYLKHRFICPHQPSKLFGVFCSPSACNLIDALFWIMASSLKMLYFKCLFRQTLNILDNKSTKEFFGNLNYLLSIILMSITKLILLLILALSLRSKDHSTQA